MLSLLCNVALSVELNDCHENINKDFKFCKPVDGDCDPRTWFRERNQPGKNNNPEYQWCKEIYEFSDKENIAKPIKNNSVKHGFGDDCVDSPKGCLTDKC